jgi:hypothetical protein
MKQISPKVNQLVFKISTNRQNSFWYHNREIARVEYRDIKLSIKSKGDIAIQFEKFGDVLKNERALEEAISLSFTDKEINKYVNSFGLKNTNHFAITDVNTNEVIEIAKTYDEAIELAQQLSVELN